MQDSPGGTVEAQAATPVAIDPARCPLCGESNACGMAADGAGGGPCWCVAETFPPALIAAVPAAARGRACICPACARAAAAAPDARAP